MYEDLYKSANDKIPTKNAKERVMAKLDTPQKVNYKASLTRIAAIAACFVFAFSMVSLYNYSKNKKQSPLVVTEHTIMPRMIQEENQGTQKSKSKDILQKPIEADGVYEENKINEIIINEGFIIAEPISANESLAREIRDVREFSRADYFKYLGKDVERDIKLPEGFSLAEEEIYAEVDDKGELLWDIKSFVYKNGEKQIEIRTTKNLTSVSEIIKSDEYKKAGILGFDAVISTDGEYFSGYMIANDIAFSVFGNKLTDNEIFELFKSLT